MPWTSETISCRFNGAVTAAVDETTLGMAGRQVLGNFAGDRGTFTKEVSDE